MQATRKIREAVSNIPSLPSRPPAGNSWKSCCFASNQKRGPPARQALLSSMRGRTDFHSPDTPGHGARSRTHPTVQRQAGSPDNSAWRRRARSAGTHRLCGLQPPSRRALAMSTNRPAPDAAGGAAGGRAVRYFVPLQSPRPRRPLMPRSARRQPPSAHIGGAASRAWGQRATAAQRGATWPPGTARRRRQSGVCTLERREHSHTIRGAA